MKMQLFYRKEGIFVNQETCKPITPTPIIPECLHYASAYIPFQYMTVLYEPEEGLQNGSIFPELVDDFTKNM